MSQEKVAAGHRYVRELFEAKPERARATATSTVTLRDGLACEIVEGPWRLAADMSEKAGGTGAAPTPGVLGRAALGSCIAISFMYEASNAGVDVAGVQVEVQTDFDDGGMFGTSDAPPGYLEVRYEIRVESEAPDEELARVAAAAAERTPYLDVFGRAQTLTPSLRVVRSGTPTAEAP
jgi:uncharacterized OsmC-like protein